jgi:uncharacterized protein
MSTHSHFDAMQIERPHSSLLTYYLIVSLFAGPLFPVVFIPFLIRYSTLRFKFDDDGISMCWGILFRREIYLTYRRIQDINLTRNIVQRWMNLSTISVQTASGKAEAEMSIEGIIQSEELRNYLYSNMRGAKTANQPADVAPQLLSSDSQSGVASGADRATQALQEIRDALQKLVSSKQANS